MAVLKDKKTIILLLIILLIAVFFRLWQIDSIPPGLYPDEAINGNEALDTLETKNFKVFYPENNGREGLFIWLLSFSFLIFGPSIWALKLIPAIIGILTVLGLYLLTKELFSQYIKKSSRYIALLASFFLTISFWHINFSRIGFRAILIPFILVFSFYFLFKGFREKKALFFVISGIFFGLGFYTYISYRFVVLLLAITLICWWLVYKKQNLQKKFLLFALYCLLFTFITALPMGLYFLKNPQDFMGRATGVSVFVQENPVREAGKSLISHLGMFNIRGDSNWRHNFADSPQLLWPIGIFFLIGIVLSIKELVISLKRKTCSMFTVHCLLLSWFFIMLLPGVLSYEGIPHALRLIGVIPVVYVFAGLGAWWLFKKLKSFYKTKNQLIAFYLCLSILFLVLGYSQFNKYFYQWGKNPEVQGAFSKNYVAIGNYLNTLPDNVQKYVIVNQSGVPVPWPDGIPMPAQTLIFIERTKFGQIRSTYLLTEDLNQIKIDKKTVIVPLQYDDDLFSKLLILFPDGKFQEKNGIWIIKN